MSLRENKVEILAPAGSYDILMADFAAGADAVYLGGAMFGARAYANNFSEEELLRALDYAHLHDKKIYLTVNTLMSWTTVFSHIWNRFIRRDFRLLLYRILGHLKQSKKHFRDCTFMPALR